jgi:tetratricopeptide (TPR) repeat protein
MITQRTWPAVMTLCLAFVVGSVMSAQTPPAGNDLFARAAAAARQGNSGSARSYAGQALEISRRTHDRSLEANCLLLLGQLEASEGNFLEALQDFRASLPIWTEIKGWNGGALAMDEIGSSTNRIRPSIRT